jgi:hypothetical protein
MSKLAKFAIAVNSLLGLLYVVSSFLLWNIVNGPNWSYYGAVARWSPLYVTPIYIQPIQERVFLIGSAIPTQMVNVPFLLFLTMFAVNIFTIIFSTKRYTLRNTEQLVCSKYAN